MSIFGDIMSAIFGHSASAAPAGSAPQVQPSPLHKQVMIKLAEMVARFQRI